MRSADDHDALRRQDPSFFDLLGQGRRRHASVWIGLKSMAVAQRPGRRDLVFTGRFDGTVYALELGDGFVDVDRVANGYRGGLRRTGDFADKLPAVAKAW